MNSEAFAICRSIYMKMAPKKWFNSASEFFPIKHSYLSHPIQMYDSLLLAWSYPNWEDVYAGYDYEDFESFREEESAVFTYLHKCTMFFIS